MTGSGERLQRAIRRRHASAADFSRSVGVKVGTIRAQISRDSVSKELAPKFARALRVKEDWLLYGKGPDPFSGEDLGDLTQLRSLASSHPTNESAMALEVMDFIAKLLNLTDMEKDQRGELLEDSRELIKKYKR